MHAKKCRGLYDLTEPIPLSEDSLASL